jgi:hypothetical protein
MGVRQVNGEKVLQLLRGWRLKGGQVARAVGQLQDIPACGNLTGSLKNAK